MDKIESGKLAAALESMLETYSSEVAEATKRAVDETAERTNEIIKGNAPVSSKKGTRTVKRSGGAGRRKRGTYKRAMRIKTAYESTSEKRVVWYVSGREYALTWLLENGHALRQGGRSPAKPHISYGDTYVKEHLADNIAEEVKKIGH